jgi:hypothetical protein
MESRSIRTLYWPSAAPRARHSRVAPFKSMVAFVTDQMLLLWPPYRVEHDCDCCKPDVPESDQDQNAD